MFPCLHLHVSMSPCFRNSANEKRQLLLVCCKRKTETENGSFFCLVGNWQTVIDDCCFSKRARLWLLYTYVYCLT
jgi:hypothetical protein